MSFNLLYAQNKDLSPQLADSLVWEITGPDLAEPSYLAGTIHLICEQDFQLDQRMINAIKNSNQIYLELDMDDQSEMSKVMTGMVSDKSLKDRLSSTHYKQLSELIEKHTDFNINLFDKTKLFGISSMLLMSGLDCPIKTVDIELMNIAKASKLPVYGLEKAEDQLEVFELMVPKKSDIPWSEKEMAAFGLLPETLNEVVKVYNSEDISALYDMTKDLMLEAENGTVMFEALLDKRNINWVEKIPTIVKKSSLEASFHRHIFSNVNLELEYRFIVNQRKPATVDARSSWTRALFRVEVPKGRPPAV